MRGLVQSGIAAVAQAAIHFNSGRESIRTESARLSTGQQLERAAARHRVTEFPRTGGKILFCENVFAYIPAAEIASQNQLDFDFPLFLFPALRIWIGEVRKSVMANHLPKALVRSIQVLELHVEHR